MKSEEQKSKIKLSVQKTKERRHSMQCKVIECKLDASSLSTVQKDQLNKLFLETKWFYNHILSTNNIKDFDTKINEVQVKVLGEFQNRSLEQISAQMKQGLHTRMFNSLSTLSSLKSKGFNVGKLKFKSQINSIPLKQHFQTFTILKNSKRIKIQGIKKPMRAYGLEQLPSNCEIANANLCKTGKDFYVKITIYAKKEPLNPKNESIGIDFGCESQLTLSNGEKIEFAVPISKRIKRLDKQIARKEAKRKQHNSKKSKNHIKCLEKRQKEYLKLTNKRKDIKNKIVHKLVNNYKIICFQDEMLNKWKQSGHGKKIQFSAIGGIIAALKNKAATPIAVKKEFPSSQLCNCCGNRKKMHQNIRVYKCEKCSKEEDRDVNAAKNIEKEGMENLRKILTERKEFKPVEIKTSSNLSKGLQVWSAKQEVIMPSGE